MLHNLYSQKRISAKCHLKRNIWETKSEGENCQERLHCNLYHRKVSLLNFINKMHFSESYAETKTGGGHVSSFQTELG